MGADCKSVGFAFEGSNPSPATGRASARHLTPTSCGGLLLPEEKSRRGSPTDAQRTFVADLVRQRAADPSQTSTRPVGWWRQEPDREGAEAEYHPTEDDETDVAVQQH